MKYKCQCGALVKSGDDHYCRAYPDKLLARIAELEAENAKLKEALANIWTLHATNNACLTD